MNSCSSSNSCGGPTPPPGGGNPPKENTPSPLELHACMGLNACKGHDRFGDNKCAGMGFCATITHTCHSLNDCRGQGGCGLYGDARQQNEPGNNSCAFTGSCATPINAERFSTLGPNKNKKVWARARELFTERMHKTGRQFGPAPFPEGPPIWWLEAQEGGFTACGASGMSGNTCS